MTNIGPTVTIAGEISADEDITVHGCLDGRITVRNGTITVGERGRIDADLRATRVTILGRVRGGVFAADRIELAASAVVTGNLSANQVVIHDGATFNGGVDMAQRTIASKVAQFKAAQMSS